MNVILPYNSSYGRNITVNITLPSDARGNITINGHTIILDDSFNGTIIYNISGLSGGIHNITVKYNGNNTSDEITKTITTHHYY